MNGIQTHNLHNRGQMFDHVSHRHHRSNFFAPKAIFSSSEEINLGETAWSVSGQAINKVLFSGHKQIKTCRSFSVKKKDNSRKPALIILIKLLVT